MQRRVNEFTLEPINNVLQNTIFGISSISPGPTPTEFVFLLMNGGNFTLMNGLDLLLMRTI
jgi:hypothetical protein